MYVLGALDLFRFLTQRHAPQKVYQSHPVALSFEYYGPFVLLVLPEAMHAAFHYSDAFVPETQMASFT